MGLARFGYGGAGEITRLSYGPIPADKYVSTWFRRQFIVQDPRAVGQLKLRLTFEDGIVVFLNGDEVLRLNLPEGAISASTTALTNVTGSARTAWIEVGLDPVRLRAGTNVIAAEVHLNSRSDNQLGFDAEATAVLTTNAPAMTCQAQHDPGAAEVCFAPRFGQAYTVLVSTNLLDWVALTSAIGDGKRVRIVEPIAPAPSQRFYRVRLP